MIKMIVLVLVVLASTAASGVTEAESLLVRLETRYSAPDFNTRNEVFVFRDGAVLHRVRSKSHQNAPVLRVIRLQATDPQMAALMRALQLNRVGMQTGGCAFRADNPLLGYVQAQIDWFGKGSRQNSFAVESRFPQSCGNQVEAIVGEIEITATSATQISSEAVSDLIEELE